MARSGKKAHMYFQAVRRDYRDWDLSDGVLGTYPIDVDKRQAERDLIAKGSIDAATEMFWLTQWGVR